MRVKSIILSGLLPVSLMLLISCGQQQKDFQAKKLDLRQKVDAAVLKIDKQIEQVRKSVEDSTSQRSYVDALTSFRGDLSQDRTELSDVDMGDWSTFKTQVDTTLQQLDQLVEGIRLQEMPQINPYSMSN